MAEFTLERVNESIAAVVSSALPGVTVYDSPSQQGVQLPALFITYRGEQRTEDQIGGRSLRKLRYDLCYLERQNLPDLGDRYRRAAEALDLALETIPYPDGRPLRTAKRRWLVEPDALHYQFDINARVSVPYSPHYMENMELREDLS